MSSILALSELSSVKGGQNTLERLEYLRKNDPTYLRYDWSNAELWAEVMNCSEDGLNIRMLCQDACNVFITSDSLLVELVCNGREALISNLSHDEMQVFRTAGLLENIPDYDVVEWWDRLKLQAKKNLDKELLDQGRKAESWTIDEELSYLAPFFPELTPQWVSLDGDYFGYDIGSYRFANEVATAIKIEVKSFSRLNDPHFYLTRHEWKNAEAAKPNYIFYVWCMEIKEYKILTVEEVRPHIPVNQGEGEWQNLYVSFDW